MAASLHAALRPCRGSPRPPETSKNSRLLTSNYPTSAFLSSSHWPPQTPAGTSLCDWSVDQHAAKYWTSITKSNSRNRSISKSNGIRIRSLLDYGSNNRSAMQQRANEIINSASLLLVYRNVLQNPPSQSFLRLVLLLRRREDSAKVSEAFGEFYNQLSMQGYSSWKSYLLDKILEGENNPFAKACSGQIFLQKQFKIKSILSDTTIVGGENESKNSAGQEMDIKSCHIPSSLYSAAYSDLHLLQKIAISEKSLLEMMNDFLEGTNEVWKKAVSSSLRDSFPVQNLNLLLEENQESTNVKPTSSQPQFGFYVPSNQSNVSQTDNGDRVPDNGFSFEEESTVEDFSQPYSVYETRVCSEFLHLKSKISKLKNWSHGIELLRDIYFKYGSGVCSYTPVTECKNGKLVPLDSEFPSDANLSFHEKYRQTVENVFQHQMSSPFPNHILLYGESGLGKTRLCLSILKKFSTQKYFRILILDRKEIKYFGQIVSEISNHPNLRFCIFIDDLSFKLGDESVLTFKSVIDGFPQPWPNNAFLLATSPSMDLVRSSQSTATIASSAGGPDLTSLASRFHTRVHMPKMSRDEWCKCVIEIAEFHGRSDLSSVEFQSSERGSDGGSTVLSASQFVVQSSSP